MEFKCPKCANIDPIVTEVFPVELKQDEKSNYNYDKLTIHQGVCLHCGTVYALRIDYIGIK